MFLILQRCYLRKKNLAERKKTLFLNYEFFVTKWIVILMKNSICSNLQLIAKFANIVNNLGCFSEVTVIKKSIIIISKYNG